MKLYQSREPPKPFRCPTCREFLTTDANKCRFCGSDINQSAASEAARLEMLANRLYRKKNYLKHLISGSGLFALGIILMIASFYLFREMLDTDFVWIPRALVIGGGGDALYGIYGLASEALNARRELL